MQKIKDFFKNMKWSAVMIAVGYVIFGLIMLILVDYVKEKLSDILGIGLVIIGLIHVTQYFMQEMQKSYYSNDFMEGIIMIMLGILSIYQKGLVNELVPYLLSIAVIGSGVAKLQDGIDAKRMGDKNIVMFMVLAVISLALGSVVLFNIVSGDTLPYTIVGAGLLYSGATDLFCVFYLSSRYVSYLHPKEEKPEETPALPIEPTPVIPEVVDTPVPPTPVEPPVAPVMDSPVSDPTTPVEPVTPVETPAPAETPAETSEETTEPTESK